MTRKLIGRRDFVKVTAAGAATVSGLGSILIARKAPAAVTLDPARPSTAWGLQIGDVLDDRALVWSRTDRVSRLFVEWSRDEHFRLPHVFVGSLATSDNDFTARVDLRGLPAGEDIYLRAAFESFSGRPSVSAPLAGRFRTAPRRCRDVRFVWGGDTAGQGWGIDLDFGGMKIYEAMRRTEPDFFLHSGDNIYADGTLAPEVTDAAGAVVWRNAFLDVVPEKLKVAETVHEYRRNYLYNRYDQSIQRFTAEVPQVWQWDDHETVNNWSPSKVLDSRYTVVTNIADLAANSRQAFLEYAPIRPQRADRSGRIYRRIPYGPDLEVFVLDMRSYRAGNGCNVETEPGPATVYMGAEQIEWLKRGLRESRATWKVIAADMPLGIVVGDGVNPQSGCAQFENSSNGDGPVLGREFEIADILRCIKSARVQNVVWLTADVHYAAANYYDPSVAQFQDFEPFWEFVAGPLNAGTFGPNGLDDTFGPTIIFQKTPETGQSNLSPRAGLQFFGQVDIDCVSKTMTVALKDIDGAEIFSQELQAAGQP